MTANNPSKPQPSSLDFQDLCYVLFRHKGKIIVLAVAGILGAAALLFLKPPVYQSEGKLFVRYVLDRGESRSLTPTGGDPNQVRLPDPRGEGIINTEKEILDSFDLANQVAALIGPEKILGKAAGENDLAKAASLIKKNLTVEAPKNSSILTVVFRHEDPNVAQNVVGLMITNYVKKHVALHRPASALDDLRKQTDERRAELAKTEAELSRALSDAGITSLDDGKKYAEQMLKIKEKLDEAEVDLAARRAALGELQTPSTVNSNQVVKPAVAETETPAISPEKIDEYKSEYKDLAAQLDSLQKKHMEYLGIYQPDSIVVKSIRIEIAKVDKRKRELEKTYPPLTKVNAAVAAATGSQTASGIDPAAAAAQEKASLEARVRTLREQFDQVAGKVDKVREFEPTITRLQRQRDGQENSYRSLQARVEQWSAEESVGAGKFSAIPVAQEPSPPAREMAKTLKAAGIIMAMGLLGGLGLAFFIELVFDRSVRRPKDLTDKLRLPLFLTIPYLSRNGHARVSQKSVADPNASGAQADWPEDSQRPAPALITGFDERGKMRVYCEALRDRLINYFDLNNMAHKPKLIAVAGCSKGSGTTSTAAGLAATLSETGDGNVLLVDMNLHQGAAHPFYKGRPACGLLDVLESDKRSPAQVHENLFVASVNKAADQLPAVLPRRFMHLLPKLKMSDYDYVIFDMPAVSQTSITPKVAALMDMVLLVVESGKTNQRSVEQATSMLAETRANVKVVLNKYRRHVPQWLEPEL